MADWRDGSEYASIERPEGFATPRVADLSRPEPRVDLASGQPPVAPDAFVPNPTPVPPLDALVPDRGPQRDPRQAFDSSSAAVTTGSAWGAAHAGPSAHAGGQPTAPAWTPQQPLTTSNAVDPTGFAPPSGAPIAPAFPAPTSPGAPAWGGTAPQPGTGNLSQQVMQLVNQLGLPLVLVLLVGIVARPLSLVLLLAAVVLAFRARTARETLVRVHAIAAAVAVLGGLVLPGNLDLVDAMNRWASLACLGALVASVIVVRRTPTGRP